MDWSNYIINHKKKIAIKILQNENNRTRRINKRV
jgi:hypothetical protein